MGEFFKEVKPLSYQPKRSFHPPMDIYETGDSLVIVMEIAGVRGEDIQVLFEKSLLAISGTRTEFSPSPKTQLHQMEIDYGYFDGPCMSHSPSMWTRSRPPTAKDFSWSLYPKRKNPSPRPWR